MATTFVLPFGSGKLTDDARGGINLSGLQPGFLARAARIFPPMTPSSDSTFRDIIAQVKENADIVAIIGQYLPLKKAGSRWLGVCPFHHDRRPSMNVTPQMGIYKCFACGAGGDVIRFVQDYEKLSFVDALRAVAARTGIQVPEKFSVSEGGGREKTELALAANQLAAAYYSEQIEKAPFVLDYLEKRGINPETRRQFQLGFAPDSLDGLLRRAESRKLPLEALSEAGILGVTEGGRRYERFGGRLVFPIWNLSGHIIGFGGRTLDPQGQPKYVNSPESPLYHKSRVLYGFNFARNAIDKAQEVVLVEGYMDLLSLWQAGIKNAVAVSGTALTRDHVHILGRFAKRAVLFFDGDGAGRKAVKRSLEPLLAQGVEIRVPVLPSQEDPDSFIRQNGAEGVLQLFAGGDDLAGFLLREAGKEPEKMSPEEKDSVFKEGAALMQLMPSEVVRQGHLETLRKALKISAGAVSYAPVPQKGKPKQGPQPPAGGGGLPGLFVPESGFRPRDEAIPEWQLLQLVLAYPGAASERLEHFDIDELQDPVVRDLLDHALALLAETGEIRLTELSERLPENLRDALLAVENLEAAADTEKSASRLKMLGDIVYTLEMRVLKRRLSAETDLARHMELQRQVKELTHRNQGGTP